MLLTLIASLVVGATSASIEAKLTWHQAKVDDPVMRILTMRVFGSLSPVHPNPVKISSVSADTLRRSTPKFPTGYSVPKGAYKAYFASLYMGPDKSILAVAASSTPSGSMDRIWIDWNRNKVFEASEMAKLTSGKEPVSRTDIFEYTTPPKNEFGPVYVKVRLLGHLFVELVPIAYREGTIRLSGKEVSIYAFDMGFNGAYNDSSDERSADMVILGYQPIRLPGLILLEDRKYWAPKVAKDGQSVAFVQDERPVGTVLFAGDTLVGAQAIVPKLDIITYPVDGKLILPEGNYGIYANFLKSTPDGKQWMYAVRVDDPYSVKANTSQTIQVGGPFQLHLDLDEAAGFHNFNLTLTDHEVHVESISDAKGQRPPAPQLRITDPTGKVVKTIDFEYG